MKVKNWSKQRKISSIFKMYLINKKTQAHIFATLNALLGALHFISFFFPSRRSFSQLFVRPWIFEKPLDVLVYVACGNINGAEKRGENETYFCLSTWLTFCGGPKEKARLASWEINVFRGSADRICAKFSFANCLRLLKYNLRYFSRV